MYIKSLDEILTPHGLQKSLADRIKQRRLEKNITQKSLAYKSGVSYSSLRKFENSGDISLESLVKIAFSLNLENDFSELFSKPAYNTLDEMLEAKNNKSRKRAGKGVVSRTE